MASIIKNQLLKHLSRFTKNLSADKINLSTFKGEGELTNLELDEIVLTNLLELPSWLRLTNALCNKVTFRIQWTKLKSVPIYLSLDEVKIEVETCEDLRRMSSTHGLSSFAGPAKYSFIHKVIDGITISVNTVLVTFKSPAFIASVQMSRITVESKSPTWTRCDLRMTRVKDPDRGQLLIFKELEWQTVRIEAKSTKDEDLTPLRLLTNQARCRITIKKRLSGQILEKCKQSIDESWTDFIQNDYISPRFIVARYCFVMGSRLVIILDDLLWVLTDSQLKAALRFIDSLGGLIEKATILERKAKAARKLEVLPEYQAQLSQQARTKNVNNTALSKIFTKYDVVETSYHFLSEKIDLHLCDDEGAGRSMYPDLKDGGALQISLQKFQIDYYPYHLAMADRKHWAKYKENSTPHGQWLQQSLNSFRDQFMDLIDTGRSQHSPLTRSQGNVSANNSKSTIENQDKNVQNSQNQNSQESKKSSQQPSGNPVKNYVLEHLAKLMTTCIVMRISDFTFYRVTTSARKSIPKEFIVGDKDRFYLPEDINIFHVEFTYFYYPGDITFPLPPPKFYVQLNPIQVNFNVLSCLWFNSFLLNLYHSLLSNENRLNSTPTNNLIYFDVKIEAIHPRIIFESQQDYPNQKDRPKSLHIQTSRAIITNVRNTERSSRADLAQCLNAFQAGQMFFSTEFPNVKGDFHVVTEKFLGHSTGTDSIRSFPTNFSSNSVNEMVRQLNRELLWTEAKDVWCCHFEPVWGDFFGARAVGQNRAIPFLDAFPLTLWLHIRTDSVITPDLNITNEPSADIHGLAYVGNLISMQINHYQYLFLLRLSEEIAEMATYLSVDSNRILKVDSESSLVLGAIVPQVEVTFIMPSQNPGKENSGGDLESVVPDSSSIADDIAGSTVLWSSAVTARLDYGTKRMNTSNDVDTPQSEVSSMFSMDRWNDQQQQLQQQQQMATTSHQVVTFKQHNGTNKVEMQSHASKRTTDTDAAHQSGISKPFMANNFNVDLSSMKKGFSNLMTSIDSALKSSPDDGNSDTVSIRSDVSSDSENYVVVSLEDQEKTDAMFAVDNIIRISAIEEACEVVEETPDTQSEKSMDSVCRRKDLVSMATFKISKVELIQQSRGFSSSVKIQVANIGSDECSSIPWDEFQAKFSSRSRGWVELPEDSETKSRVKLRLDHSLKNPDDSKKLLQTNPPGINSSSEFDMCNKDNVMGLFQDKVTIRITDVPLSLTMSSVTGLTDLFEDEIIPKPLPVEVYLENIFLRLNEDRPPSNITSPGPIPVDVSISKLRIAREGDGVFRIEPVVTSSNVNANEMQISRNAERDMEINALRQSSKQMKLDNDELKRRLAMLERLSEENLVLRKAKEETDLLKSCLNTAKENIAALMKEKKSLQETVSMLQHQGSDDGFSNSARSSWSKR